MKFRVVGMLLFFLSVTNLIKGEESRIPYFGGAQYDYIAEADFDESALRGEHLAFRIGRIHLGTLCYHNPRCKEGVSVGLAYTQTYLRWNQNPYFNQRYFDTASFNVSGFSHRLQEWYWRGNVSFNFDTDHFDPEEYLTYDLLLWGRYTYCKNFGLHVGFYAITGMKVDRVYPILGVDWLYRKNIRINLVFPVDINATWEINKCWTTGAAIRFFESRHRVGEHAELPMAVWVYRVWGAEYFLTYNLSEFIHLNVHGGYTFGGKLKIANKHYDDGHHFKTKPAPYIGATIVMAY